MFSLFPLGQIVATPGALAALERANQPPTCFLARHAIGDWGELEPSDAAENEYGIAHGFRLLSSYTTIAGQEQIEGIDLDGPRCHITFETVSSDWLPGSAHNFPGESR